MNTKIYKFFSLLIVAMIASVSLTSCNDDDDNTFFSGPYTTFGTISLKSDKSLLIDYFNGNNTKPSQLYISTLNYGSSLADFIPGTRVMVTYNVTNRKPSGTGTGNSNSVQLIDIFKVKTLMPQSATAEQCTVGSIPVPVHSMPFIAGGFLNLVSSFTDPDAATFKVQSDAATVGTENVVLYLSCTAGNYNESDGKSTPLSIDVSPYVSEIKTRTITLKLLDTSNLTKTYTLNKN